MHADLTAHGGYAWRRALLSASLDGTVRAFDTIRYRNFQTLVSPTPAQFNCVAVDPSGELVCAGSYLLWSTKGEDVQQRTVRERADITMAGTPLTHERFLRRDRGTYGLAWAAGTGAPYSGLLSKLFPFPFPDLKTPVDGLLRCGDSCFPGIGTPSAAASGVIAANTMTDVGSHIEMLREISRKDPMYKFLDPGLLADIYKPLVQGRTPSMELRSPEERAAAAAAA